MGIFKHKLYLDDVNYVANLDLDWSKFQDSSILISGATGLLGSFLVDVIAERNEKTGLNCKIYALGRNADKARERFSYFDKKYFEFIPYDINEPLNFKAENLGYVVHLASNTHPLQYASDPIGTITTNIIGLKNMLDLCVDFKVKRFAFASTNEIYGENRGDVELFDEDYCGYINSNTLRAGYPESKRAGEALCQAYKEQKGLDIVIPRFTRSYGPTILSTDSKAISQFIFKAINNQDIVLKSEGNQYYSYTYVADAISGLLTILTKGESGEAYNIADKSSDITLKDLANLIAKQVGKEVIFELPDEIESKGFSKATKARLNGHKLSSIGWKPRYTIVEGIQRTIELLK
ncbi:MULTISPECIES: NAD-dependent epimerase/dehydratase family protein [unclassified Gemella]|uniref:NAD-dependent epimerase/dehydratase family protein n=1 Tax=unclassified Gemella TaxID=2624949 RepID=UPI00107337C2|nr:MULTISPECIES: NAD-dependent epimerase/dehydratase family protein [unclassified Gemella]MBF0709853.1 NAD-dependent epimerase/dehydratase family protein [Gemella sp. GL1.1]MBF0746843.1 NAD-dependent epimerase/dehydratase family protein [Gemella sp. 19428wG2_WT2a]NYS27197.1 NAD-dependent epimerase/dehydratase family protein [Gemella sp. GL1]TFU59568.1 NAD-dependent epimerase/dehydratase family protein [Gemella sp. WT2a]